MADEEKKKQDEVVALRYDPEQDDAPVVVASGSGHLAHRILEIAGEQQIPVIEDATLSKALRQLNLGQGIPESLFQVVAEILLFIDSLGQRQKRGDGAGG